jgi:hypothetical protein
VIRELSTGVGHNSLSSVPQEETREEEEVAQKMGKHMFFLKK